MTTANKTLKVNYLSSTSEIPSNGGSFVKLGDNNDTCVFSVNHLSSYSLSNESSSSNVTLSIFAVIFLVSVCFY